MKRLLILAALVLVLAFGLLLAQLASLRSAELPEAQRAAASGLQADSVPSGRRNAFALLWLLPWDLSPDAAATIAVEDAARIASSLAGGEIDPSALLSSAEGRYPRAPDLLDGAFVCGPGHPRCLARLRTQVSAAERALAGQQGVIERLASLDEYDHYRHLLPDHPRAPVLPALSGAQTALLTRSALDFIAGRQFLALDVNCRQIEAWRRIAAAHDQFRVQLLASASIRRHGELLADMLAELPLRAPVPESCSTALAPAPASTYPLCAAARREAQRRSEELRQRIDAPALPWYRRLTGRVMHDADRSRAWTELALSPACDGRLAERLQVGESPRWPMAGQLPPRLHCLSAPLSCHHAGLAVRDLSGHHLRLLDHQDRLRALNELLELRGRLADGEAPQRVTAYLSALEYEPESRSLRLRLRAPTLAEQDGWRLPWPGSEASR